MENNQIKPSADVSQARQYIATFRKHTLPGTAWVDTETRRIHLDDMTDDDDALFVAGEFARMEAKAARRSVKRGMRVQ